MLTLRLVYDIAATCWLTCAHAYC